MLWPGLPWAHQPISVGVADGRPVMELGDHGRGDVVRVWTNRGVPPAHLEVAGMTLAETLSACRQGTEAIVDPLMAPFTVLTADDVAAQLALAPSQPPTWASVPADARLMDGTANGSDLADALTTALGSGELVFCFAPPSYLLLFRTQAPLPADLTGAKAIMAAKHPVSPVYAVHAADIPKGLARRISHALPTERPS